MFFDEKNRQKSKRFFDGNAGLNEGGIGSGGRDRTYDQLINSQLLYR